MNRLLRKDALELRELVAAGKNPYPRKKEMLAEVYKAECIAFGRRWRPSILPGGTRTRTTTVTGT